MKNLLFAALAVTALALGYSGGRTGPIPEAAQDAKDKLAAVQKRLPGQLEDFRARAGNQDSYTPEVLGVRRLGLYEAKLTVAFRYADKGKRDADYDEMLTVLLRFYDGAWVTTELQTSWPAHGNGWGKRPTKAAHLLMQDIDAAAGE
jgi:hypothetical protein